MAHRFRLNLASKHFAQREKCVRRRRVMALSPAPIFQR
jgi:hypothetical protein